VAEDRGTRLQIASRGVRGSPLAASMSIRCDGTGSFSPQYPAGRSSRCRPEGQQPARLVPTGFTDHT
jgi:hypothetical protein